MRRLLMTGVAVALAGALMVAGAGTGFAQQPSPPSSSGTEEEAHDPSSATEDDNGESAPAAAEVDGITLEASSTGIDAGDDVTLSGKVSPPAEDVDVSIIRARDGAQKPTTTDAGGAFSITLAPKRTTTYKAVAKGHESEPVTVEVLNRRVTLQASRRAVTIRRSVRLSGAVFPAEAGQQIAIVRLDTNRPVRRLTTGSNGTFSTKLSPRRTLRYRAHVGNVRSGGVRVGVRALAGIAMRRVNLFGRALVQGAVRPSSPGGRVTVTILRNGKAVATRRARLRDGRRYRIRFYVAKPGAYRARVLFDDPAHLPARATSGSERTSLPSLREGSTGGAVKRLERRLRSLGYHLPRADRAYTHQTHDAVLAFNKVQGRARVGSVTARTWRALAKPRRPRARLRTRRFHIEVDQTRQVLYTVRNRRVRKILHVSTGGAGVGVTRDGRWRVHRRLAGFSPGRLYYPSYFDGLRAIHGWPEVPPTPASHGCVRVPMWAARWIFDQTSVGTLVNVYHS